jgi:hypothetical protein
MPKWISLRKKWAGTCSYSLLEINETEITNHKRFSFGSAEFQVSNLLISRAGSQYDPERAAEQTLRFQPHHAKTARGGGPTFALQTSMADGAMPAHLRVASHEGREIDRWGDSDERKAETDIAARNGPAAQGIDFLRGLAARVNSCPDLSRSRTLFPKS